MEYKKHCLGVLSLLYLRLFGFPFADCKSPKPKAVPDPVPGPLHFVSFFVCRSLFPPHSLAFPRKVICSPWPRGLSPLGNWQSAQRGRWAFSVTNDLIDDNDPDFLCISALFALSICIIFFCFPAPSPILSDCLSVWVSLSPFSLRNAIYFCLRHRRKCLVNLLIRIGGDQNQTICVFVCQLYTETPTKSHHLGPNSDQKGVRRESEREREKNWPKDM